jgi:predicted aspartyl protease
MIGGVVNMRLEAVVRIRVRGPNAVELTVDAILDSGFSASLTLPTAAVATLGLTRESSGGAVLADGSLKQFNIYGAEVEWDGGWRPVLVSLIGDEALIGMRLLAGHELRVAIVPGGSVEIRPLP